MSNGSAGQPGPTDPCKINAALHYYDHVGLLVRRLLEVPIGQPHLEFTAGPDVLTTRPGQIPDRGQELLWATTGLSVGPIGALPGSPR
ncbi:MAG TPA: hypothetical protein VMV92_06735 [Streptosporangiaceae bacterium]|nr:hypothetical protein [Streptosporangiaceae bacterium]